MYRPDWFRQLEYLPDYLLAGVAGYAAKEERGQRADDYGTVRRHDIPARYGRGKRRRRSKRCGGSDDGGSAVLILLYNENQERLLIKTALQ